MSAKAKGGLGRGLGALIPSTGPGYDEVDIDLVVSNPHQPRLSLNREALEELAQSIRVHGVIQPLLVSRVQQPDGGVVYQLIAGERRLQAGRLAGLSRIPVVVRETAPHELIELALVENVQRQDLTPLETAQAYRRLIDEFDLTQAAVAERVGFSRAAVANTLRLLTLPAEVRSALARGDITEGHARALLGLSSDGERVELCGAVVREGLTVRATEELVRRRGEGVAARRKGPRTRVPDPDVAAIEERLRGILGTKVQLTWGRKGGRLTIHFYSDEDLESLVEILGGNVEALAERR